MSGRLPLDVSIVANFRNVLLNSSAVPYNFQPEYDPFIAHKI